MSKPNLKPCPFCGAIPEKLNRGADFYILHEKGCFFEAWEEHYLIDPTDKQEAAPWNRRADTAKKRGEGGGNGG